MRASPQDEEGSAGLTKAHLTELVGFTEFASRPYDSVPLSATSLLGDFGSLTLVGLKPEFFGGTGRRRPCPPQRQVRHPGDRR